MFNAGLRLRGAIEQLAPERVRDALLANAFGGFLVGQEAARRMLPAGRGTILFTGATASVKGFPQSAPFAMGKFGLRGLAQSMARELAPKGVHVAHIVIDGGIASSYANTDERPGRRPLPRSGRHRAQLSAFPPPAPQRVELGDRAAALDRDVLRRHPRSRFNPRRKKRVRSEDMQPFSGSIWTIGCVLLRGASVRLCLGGALRFPG